VAEPPLMNTDAGLTVKVRPGELDADNVTVPTNPLTADTVIVDVPVAPATKLKLTGLVTRAKSVTAKVTETLWLWEPLVPVTVTAYVPAEPLQNSVELWLGPRTMLVAFSVQVRPEEKPDDARVTVPVKPLIGVTVMVELLTVPALIVMAVGLALMVKSDVGALLLKVAV